MMLSGATGAALRVLLAEDNPGQFEIVPPAFERSGAADRLEVVHDGEQLVAVLSRTECAEPPDVVLFDLRKPAEFVDYMDTARKLRRHRRTAA
jgi:CheY-like chemotaxis protein